MLAHPYKGCLVSGELQHKPCRFGGATDGDVLPGGGTDKSYNGHDGFPYMLKTRRGNTPQAKW
jgi:hypothetical protein